MHMRFNCTNIRGLEGFVTAMFAYLRYFSIISFVLVVAGAGAVGIVFQRIAADDLESLVRKTNLSLSQGFINTVWRPHYPDLYIEFRNEARKFFEEMPIAKMNVYDKRGKLLFTSNSSQLLIDPEYLNGPRFGFNEALQGQTATRILEHSGFETPSGQQTTGTLVHTVRPILSDQFPSVLGGAAKNPGERVEGIAEIFFDITPQWERLSTFRMVSTGSIIGLFVILISLLIFTSRRAESIIAKQHEVNLELTAAAAAAEAENRDKSQFLANISHELRTPLNAIIGFSEIIKADAQSTLPPTQQDYIRDIHSSGVHLLSLINDILDYSKAEAGKLEMDLMEVDVTKVIKNSMRLVIPRAEEAQVTLVEDIPTQHFVMMADGKKLKQVLLNLLSNAVKFTPSGGEVRVALWENVVDRTICIQVKDSGIGISPKDISRVMTPFGQVDSTLARRYEGTGLGLPLSKKFVETMGGTFSIESEVNVGTTITIKLPQAKLASGGSASESEASHVNPDQQQP